jgi:hypothetical protein
VHCPAGRRLDSDLPSHVHDVVVNVTFEFSAPAGTDVAAIALRAFPDSPNNNLWSALEQALLPLLNRGGLAPGTGAGTAVRVRRLQLDLSACKRRLFLGLGKTLVLAGAVAQLVAEGVLVASVGTAALPYLVLGLGLYATLKYVLRLFSLLSLPSLPSLLHCSFGTTHARSTKGHVMLCLRFMPWLPHPCCTPLALPCQQ